MTTTFNSKNIESEKSNFPIHGWLGLGLITLFWILNWTLTGPHTHWVFFPLWLGYCLTVDGLVVWRTGTSLFTRSWRKYIGLFLISAPVWWMFELLNIRLQNWKYIGLEGFSWFQYVFWTTWSFTTVIPAVFGSAEFFASFDFLKRLPRGPVIGTDKRTTLGFFSAGWIMFILMLIYPKFFFPFMWLSIYFILEPINVWRGHRNLANWTRHGNWRPVIALWLGVLLTALFWEMWNYLAYPKWIYEVPWGNWLHIFEMPLLGYGGYLPFALELFALYHLIIGLFGSKDTDYIKLISEESD